MKPVQNPRRGRGRSGPGKRHQPTKNRNFESNGGDNKVRGNAQQVLDKYQALARDAAAAGEHILAEGYWQHAEHYYRILNADRGDRPLTQGNDSNHNNFDNDEDDVDSNETPRVEKPNSREIPIQSVVEAPVSNGAEDGSTEQPQPVRQVRLTEQSYDQIAPVPITPEIPEAEASEAEKPKRRGRPRKVAADPDDASKTPDSDTSSETVSA